MCCGIRGIKPFRMSSLEKKKKKPLTSTWLPSALLGENNEANIYHFHLFCPAVYVELTVMARMTAQGSRDTYFSPHTLSETPLQTFSS